MSEPKAGEVSGGPLLASAYSCLLQWGGSHHWRDQGADISPHLGSPGGPGDQTYWFTDPQMGSLGHPAGAADWVIALALCVGDKAGAGAHALQSWLFPDPEAQAALVQAGEP